MPYDFSHMTDHVDRIKTGLSPATLSEQIKQNAKGFKKLANRIIDEFDRENDDDIKLRHLVTLFGLARLHQGMIRNERTSQQGMTNRISSYSPLNEDPDEAYYQALKSSIAGLANCMQFYLDTDDAQDVMKIVGEGEALSYQVGDVMKDILTAPFASLTQLERKLFVVTYFDTLENKADASLSRTLSLAVVGNALGFALGGPLGLAATASLTTYAYPKASGSAAQTKRSLERNGFNDHIENWKYTIQTLIANETTAGHATQFPATVTPDLKSKRLETASI